MRLSLCICLVLVSVPAGSFAQQSTTPGYTAFDQKQFAKLRAGVGTWNCTNVPAGKKPDVITMAQQGNWFVSHETGDSPNTSYTRWSHGYQHYFSATMDPLGDMTVAQTADSDPFNATWTYAVPTMTPDKKPLLPYRVSLSGNTMVSQGGYYDNKSRLLHFKSTCVKQ